MHDPLINQLHAVLDQERRALMSADFEPLRSLLARKEDLLGRLAISAPSTNALRPIRAKMDDNQTLLASAIKGVAAAGERLRALHNVQNGLTIYDHSGRVKLTQNHQHSLEKKA